MEKRIYKKEQFETGKWSGGTTTEFALFPPKSSYLERDFIWRLSSIQSEEEESVLPRLPDYDRIILITEGEAVFVHGDQRTVKLSSMEQDRFDGAVKTDCYGKIRDYNLIVKKGCYSSLKTVEPQHEARPIEITTEGKNFSHGSCGFFCQEGYVVVSVDGQTCMVQEGQQFAVDFQTGETPDISLMGEGQVIYTEVFYDMQAHVAEEIPEERATFEDFKAAFKLTHSRYKWGQFSAGKKKVWYDEALQKKLKFLDRSYIDFFVWMAGLLILIFLTMDRLPEAQLFAAALGWSALHLLLLAPLLSLIILPKPIKAHIKNIDQLTEYERGLYEKQLEENEHTDKILRKYKNSGKKRQDDREER